MYIKYLAGLVLIVITVLIGFEFQKTSLSSPQEFLIPAGAQGNLPMPETEFDPILQSAKQEMDRRFAHAETLNMWQRVLRWLALIITSAVTIIAGFFGRRVNPESNSSITVEDVLDKSAQSQLNIRLIGILLALSTVCGIFAQQLESESINSINQAESLNQTIIETIEIIYDTESTEIKARLALQKLEGATARP